MGKKKKQIEGRSPDHQLRDEAEGKLASFLGVPDGIQEKNFEEVIHELQIHQIELEMQNEELRKTQVALEEARERYADLYHFAPVGYFTFTPEALIKEVNLTGSTLLGVARQKLINTRFRKIVTANDQDLWDQHFLSVLREGEKQTCDLILRRQEGSPFYAGLESIRREAGRGAFQVHTTVTDITERKRLEEVIGQSEERYRTAIIEEIGEGYYEVDLAGNFTFVNDSMSRQLQYSREELIGMNCRTYIPPEEMEEVYKTFNRVYRTGEIIKDNPVRSRRKDGTPLFTEDSISCRRDKEGRIIGFRGICRDITQRKQAEAKLIESEERYRSLASTDDSMYLVDKESRFRFMNDAHLSRLNISLDEVIGRSYGEFHSEEDTQQFAGLVKEVFETNASFQVEHKSEREPKYFLRTFSPVRDPQGNVTAVTVISKDITNRRQMEEALRSERNFAEGLINTAQAIILILDPEGRIVRFNPYLEKLSGYSLSEVQGKDWFSTFLPPQDQTMMKSLFLKAMNDIQTQGNVNHVVTKDGRIRQIEWHDITLKDADGNSIGVLAAGQDITDRKQAEQELLKYQKQLQALAIKLSEVEETERKEIARTLHDLVGQNLTALNLNLNIVLGLVAKDQKSLISSRLEDSQIMLEETTQHIREVMSDLRPSVLDDFGLLSSLHWYGQRFQRRTGIQINVEGEEFLPRLSTVMETIIFRIVQEALTNVSKHSSASQVDLLLERVGDRAGLTITDDGRGFGFKGFRLGGENRGWGLVMMRERAVALGGDLQISSEPGKGTRVILQLPVER